MPQAEGGYTQHPQFANTPPLSPETQAHNPALP